MPKPPELLEIEPAQVGIVESALLPACVAAEVAGTASPWPSVGSPPPVPNIVFTRSEKYVVALMLMAEPFAPVPVTLASSPKPLCVL